MSSSSSISQSVRPYPLQFEGHPVGKRGNLKPRNLSETYNPFSTSLSSAQKRFDAQYAITEAEINTETDPLETTATTPESAEIPPAEDGTTIDQPKTWGQFFMTPFHFACKLISQAWNAIKHACRFCKSEALDETPATDE